MIKHWLIAGMSLLAQIPKIATGEAIDSIIKNEESALELIGEEEHMIAKAFLADFKINQPILYAMLENRKA